MNSGDSSIVDILFASLFPCQFCSQEFDVSLTDHRNLYQYVPIRQLLFSDDHVDKPRLDTIFAVRQNVIIMSATPDHPFPYAMIQRMEREHGFKVTEEDVNAAVGVAKQRCREQGRGFDLDALSGVIMFVPTKRAVVMSVPPEDREQFLPAWNARMKAEGKAELIVEEDGPR